MRTRVLAWEGRYPRTGPLRSTAEPFRGSPRVTPVDADTSRADQLRDCVDAVLRTAGGAAPTVVLTASQAAGHRRPDNLDEYGTPAGRLSPALAGLPETLVSHACASGGIALALGAALVDSGRADRVLVLGAMRPRFIESAAFRSAGALAPGPSCQPFDAAADGTALGGFTGAALLGTGDHGPALAGAGIRTLGSGAQSDRGSQAECMRAAIDGTGLRPDFVAAHATGTVHGDRVELDAVSDVATDLADTLPVTSCKGALGHSVHAAGLASAMFALEALASGTVPGTARCADPLTAGHATVLTENDELTAPAATTALVNAFGFGGSSCSLLLHWDRSTE
ncbi:beta-ketoacyl synthase N-terminal-like domain-containing protein [Tsukamurella strandjordii]|uniref:beta-ketoacyl synthase N-terminal-like domain-containing protein n=1 Tax=Tsukamurella strandjordii TaxID=147577 RepID=UPI0031D178A4